jgi:hypothetical protein
MSACRLSAFGLCCLVLCFHIAAFSRSSQVIRQPRTIFPSVPGTRLCEKKKRSPKLGRRIWFFQGGVPTYLALDICPFNEPDRSRRAGHQDAVHRVDHMHCTAGLQTGVNSQRTETAKRIRPMTSGRRRVYVGYISLKRRQPWCFWGLTPTI